MKKKEYFILSLTIFFTVLAWLIADLYHAATQEKLKDKIDAPTVQRYQIDKKVLDQLETKK